MGRIYLVIEHLEERSVRRFAESRRNTATLVVWVEAVFVAWPDSIRGGYGRASRKSERASDAVAPSGSRVDRSCTERRFI